jgi:glycosyltransferase involved in cell wall biosynthesis
MKICVVAPFPKNKDGIPRVADELLKKLCEADNVEAVTIIAHKGLDFVNPSLLQNKKVSLFIARNFMLPWVLLKTIKLYSNCDAFLLLSTPWDVFDPLRPLFFLLRLVNYGFSSGLLPRSKWIQTLYDFIIYASPDDYDYPSTSTKFYDMFKKHYVDVPARYVAISEATKRDAMRYWDLRADRITVIHLGSFATIRAPRTNFGSKRVLIISHIAPRKNHVRLIKAFELVHRENPHSNAELIIVGYLRKTVPEFDSTLQAIRQRNEGIKMTVTGYLTDSEILALYDQADVFVYPSLYEGFGLPVLEAMACGCPVIASNASSLPEVVGDAGLLVDPYDVEALAQAMLTVLENDELKRKMSREGIAQAQKFSWERAGAELLAVCQEVAARENQQKD